MKYLLLAMIMISTFTFCNAGCAKGDTGYAGEQTTSPDDEITDTTENKMKIIIGTQVFTASLANNATVKSFKTMLPLEVTMEELNENEKFYYLANHLPVNSSPGGNIQSGDLMLYSNNCVVLFYENFNTSYSYTRLGKIDNINGLKSALGGGNVKVKFELP